METTVRNLRIVVAALMAGLVAFAAVTRYVPLDIELGEQEQMLVYFVPALAIMEVAGYLILRQRLLGQARRRLQGQRPKRETPIPPELVTLTLIGAAMAEGVGLFAVIVAWLTHQQMLLGLVALVVVVMLAGFPSTSRFESAIESLQKESY